MQLLIHGFFDPTPQEQKVRLPLTKGSIILSTPLSS
jgi:hypothetical protein